MQEQEQQIQQQKIQKQAEQQQNRTTTQETGTTRSRTGIIRTTTRITNKQIRGRIILPDMWKQLNICFGTKTRHPKGSPWQWDSSPHPRTFG